MAAAGMDRNLVEAHASSKFMPAPTAGPFTAAIVGKLV